MFSLFWSRLIVKLHTDSPGQCWVTWGLILILLSFSHNSSTPYWTRLCFDACSYFAIIKWKTYGKSQLFCFLSYITELIVCFIIVFFIFLFYCCPAESSIDLPIQHAVTFSWRPFIAAFRLQAVIGELIVFNFEMDISISKKKRLPWTPFLTNVFFLFNHDSKCIQ